MMYDNSLEYNLNRAVENIKLAQQLNKRELEKKDETIQALQKRVEVLQFENREFSEYRRLNEKEHRELLSNSQFLRHELSVEQAENERLKEEICRLKQEMSSHEDKIVYLESEQEKANHIIKTLLRKIHGKTSTQSKAV